jgi:glycosyltransferase
LRISVVTVCLNRAAFLEQTIQSVQAQSYPEVEHIIIDGGSTDGTLAILKRHGSKLHHWVSEPDRGMYDAINKGCNRATGDYIHILNSDDYLAGPHVYSEVIAAIEQTGRAPFYHGNLIKVKDGQDRHIRLFECGYLPYLMSKHGSFISHPTVFMHRNLHQQLGGYSLDVPYSADYDYLLRACCATQDGGIHLPLAITCFREHPNSFTGSGAMANEKKPILANHYFQLYPWWFRLGWYGLGWSFYTAMNFSKAYKKRPYEVGL